MTAAITGRPPWRLLGREGIRPRSRDPAFLQPATRGGPLLMVQVENECGSFGKDAEYMGALRQGDMVYRTARPAGTAGVLTVKKAHDFAWMFLDGKRSATVLRTDGNDPVAQRFIQAATGGVVGSAQINIEAPDSLRLSLARDDTGGRQANLTVPALIIGHGDQLQSTDDLSGGSWQNMGSPQTGTGGDLLFTAPAEASASAMFFRVQIQ